MTPYEHSERPEEARPLRNLFLPSWAHDCHNVIIKLPCSSKQIKVHFDRIKPYTSHGNSHTTTKETREKNEGPGIDTPNFLPSSKNNPTVHIPTADVEDDEEELWETWTEEPGVDNSTPPQQGPQNETTGPDQPDDTQSPPPVITDPDPGPEPTPAPPTPSRLRSLVTRFRPRTTRQQGGVEPLPEEARKLIGRKQRSDKGTKRK